MEEMTVPLDVRNDIRWMDARGGAESEGSRRSSGGATCTARTRCQPPRSFGSCPRTGRSPRSTGGLTSGGDSRGPSRDGAKPWSGRSSTTRSPTGWTGTEWTHFLSYKPHYRPPSRTGLDSASFVHRSRRSLFILDAGEAFLSIVVPGEQSKFS